MPKAAWTTQNEGKYRTTKAFLKKYARKTRKRIAVATVRDQCAARKRT